jgi:hypothetical protein
VGFITVNNITKWDGSSWSAMGSGLDNWVYALSVSGTNVYAGGVFGSAGGNPANYIAKWDGNSWSALGLGMNGKVSALAVSGTNLYAGGEFTTAGGNPANYIAKWDGNNWSALGSGVNGNYPHILSLTVSGTNLYAGGGLSFFAGGSLVNGIAKWDGSSWSVMGSGVNNIVNALVSSASDLYAGGSFQGAGGKVSGYVARGILAGGNWLPIKFGVPGPGTNTLTFTGIPGNQYFVQYSTNLTTSQWFNLATNIAGTNALGTVQDSSATNAQRFYRVSTP